MAGGDDRAGLAGRLAADLSALDAELAEIDLLIAQATAEAERHEQKRAAASDRLAVAQASGEPAPGLLEQATALVGLTKRAAVMEAQVDVLGGKRKTLARYRDALAACAESVAGVDIDVAREGTADTLPEGGPRNSRLVLAAQEELRREIARAMHDGPAQSLTNIVLQAQIVERIVDRDPVAARAEVRQLIDMVQRTLEATKSFIFDVRPMVLDDLGLVPTLRRAARDRGRRAGVPIAFDSLGPDRRLPSDLESGLFRLIDDALGAFLALHPGQVSLRLDWGDQLEARITASPPAAGASSQPPAEDEPIESAEVPVSAAPGRRGQKGGGSKEAAGEELPPALAEMIAQRRADEAEARARALRARDIVLPESAWEELKGRARSLGLRPDLLDAGATFQATIDLAAIAPAAAAG